VLRRFDFYSIAIVALHSVNECHEIMAYVDRFSDAMKEFVLIAHGRMLA
jgi:hypothetical protein